ncbi:hypothetical protein pSalSNUABM01_102 [Salmonella phage pSal-SNUABM-01]|nr:hypothetical protein pSalSNUABM01_102 [Salmonella phage pSal-SNUABM-01]
MKVYEVTLYNDEKVRHNGTKLWTDSASVQVLLEKETIRSGEGRYDTIALYPLEQIKSVVEV